LESNKLVRPPVKYGSKRDAVNVLTTSRLGAMFGDKAMEQGRPLPNRPLPLYQGKVPSVPLGNAVAGNVGKGGCGAGRTIYGQGGSQSATPTAKPMPGSRDTLSEFGRDVPGRGRR
jgi:hypothetical protein